MDPDPFIDPLILGFSLSCLASLILTLSKGQFNLLDQQRDEDREASPAEEKIYQIWETPHILDIIAFGRLVFNALAVIFIVGAFPRQFALTEFNWLTPLYWMGFLAIYFVLTFVFPNIIAHLKPNSLAGFVYRVFYPIYLLLWFPAWCYNRFYWAVLTKFNYQAQYNFLSEEEKKELDVDVPTQEESLLEEDEREMIRNIFEFADRPVQEVMTPRVEIIALDVHSNLQTVTTLLNREKPTRIPVFEGSIDQVTGVLYTKDFLEWITSHSPETPFQLKDITRPAFFVSKSKEIDDLMKEFRLTRNHMAIVLDEFGGVAGLVTLEDILEEIVGEIYDEEDFEEKIIEKVKDGTYLVDPIISINDLEKELGIEIPGLEEHDVETLNGLVQSTIQDIPRRGARVWIDPMDIKVLKVDNRKIKRILITVPNQQIESQVIGHS